MKTVDEEGSDTDEPIVFSEWSFVMGDKMQRKDYRFDKLLAGEYEPVAKQKKSQPEYEQMNLLSMQGDVPDDEGEFLHSYIADYRRIHTYG